MTRCRRNHGGAVCFLFSSQFFPYSQHFRVSDLQDEKSYRELKGTYIYPRLCILPEDIVNHCQKKKQHLRHQLKQGGDFYTEN